MLRLVLHSLTLSSFAVILNRVLLIGTLEQVQKTGEGRRNFVYLFVCFFLVTV